jgi:hypothetical protein
MAKTAQPHLLKVASSHSLDIRHERGEHFANPWHYHPELELNLILAGEGTRFVGDSVAPFGRTCGRAARPRLGPRGRRR